MLKCTNISPLILILKIKEMRDYEAKRGCYAL